MFNLIVELPENYEIDIFDAKYERSLLTNTRKLSSDCKIKQDSIYGKPRLFLQSCKVEDNRHNQIEFLPAQRSYMVCILAVPASIKDFSLYLTLSPSDFIQECLEDLLYLRTIYSNPFFSTVLLHFSTQSSADNFFLIFNGREYEEPSNEYCYTVFISSITYLVTTETIKDSIELPLCPLCIERIDVNISGITGILRTESSNLSKER